MTRIGLLSDTHGFLDQKVLEYFRDCDQVWHAGDIGAVEISDQLAAYKPFHAVYGNIDDGKLRIMHPLVDYFLCEEVRVLILHIGGYPGHYSPEAGKLLKEKPADIFISGHS